MKETIYEKAERESNDLDTINKAKAQYDGIFERIKRYIKALFEDKPRVCKIHKVEYMEHGFNGAYDCPECRKEYYNSIRK